MIVNFGGNVHFTPRHLYVPETEEEVLAILGRHARGKVRIVGARHAWSPAIVSDDALVDLRRFNFVQIERGPDGVVWATVGGGCRIKRLLRQLHALSNATIPSLGLITEQTIAGAISTATHGSGKHSMSHYVEELRVAAYDAQGRACIHVFKQGLELQAARCALGCMGIILSVRLRCVPKYEVEETLVRCASLDDVLAAEDAYPLQQFFFIPHLWGYFAQRRRATPAFRPRRRWTAKLYRVWWFLLIDVALHWIIKLTAAFFKGPRLVRFFFRRVLPPLILKNVTVTDHSERMLVMAHHLFKHLEMELFVPAKQIGPAMEYVQAVLAAFDRRDATVPESIAATLTGIGMLGELLSLRGSFTFHYPVAVRRVLPDDAFLSMSGGTEPYYAISFITYVEQRGPFLRLASFLARSMTRLFQARPHWGKHFPLSGSDVARLYPQLGEFRRTCLQVDPNGVFRNDFTQGVLFGPLVG